MSMFNRLANVNNHYQGGYKRVLCLCSAGLLRSPTAALVLANEFSYNTRAAGLSREYALIPVDDALLTWAQEIVCMEEKQAAAVRVMLKELGLETRVISLNIPDSFPYRDPELMNLIKEMYSNYPELDKPLDPPSQG